MQGKFRNLCTGLIVVWLAGLFIASGFAQSETLIFPQFANGGFDTLRFRSTLILQNTGAGALSVMVEFFQDNGAPYNLTFTDGTTGSSRNLMLTPGTSVFLTTNGQGSLAAGWVRVSYTRSGNPLGATVIFSQYDNSDRLVTEAAVGPSPSGMALTIPVDTTRQTPYDTGVAFVNPGTGPVSGTLRLLNSTGGVLASRPFPSLAAMSHTSQFVLDLFPGVGAGLQGSLSITTSALISAVGLRVAPNVLSTLPTIEGAVTTGMSAPGITSLSASSGLPGITITISGTGFDTNPAGNTVRFGTTPATVTNATATALTVTVPALAAGRYPVTVTVGGQISNAVDFQVISGGALITLGAYKGKTSQSNLDIFFGAVAVQGTNHLYLTRTQYQAQCSRGAFTINVFGSGESDGPVDNAGQFTLTNLYGDRVQGQFDTSTHISGTINFAAFRSDMTGDCPAVTVNYNADYQPNAPAITSLNAVGSFADLTVNYAGTQPAGSQITHFNLNLIDRNFRPIQEVADDQDHYDIPFTSAITATSFSGSIRLNLSGVDPNVVGVQLLLQNNNGTMVVTLSAPANALLGM